MSVKPIRPSDVTGVKATIIPDEVMTAFNELIAQNSNNGVATFTQDTVIARIMSKMMTTETIIFEKHWLDVEGIYRKEGWDVEYDKPGWDESYPAKFIFRRPRCKSEPLSTK